MNSRKKFRWSSAGAVLISGALLLQGGSLAQDVMDDDELYTADSYFDTPNWVEDGYGWYDEDFDWETDADWFDDWNDTDLTAWSNDEVEAGHWGVLGYDDMGETGLFDW